MVKIVRYYYNTQQRRRYL